MARPKAGVTFLDRLYQGAERRGECLIFSGYKNNDGYGRLHKDDVLVFAHREVWKMANGDIPKGMCVCHVCDTPDCIEEKHLWLGTHAQNMEDRKKKGREHVRYGSQHSHAKIKESDVPDIRRAIAGGEADISIAKRYGVSDSLIRNIKKGRNWTHVAI